MNTIALIILILAVVSLVVFAVMSWIAVRHAARFRYLGARTIYLSLFFVSTSSVLALSALIILILILTQA
jgi:hypothetical protein